ncbi:MAG TPA: sigma-70 family RNA polymerase sigma factor [Mycobacteriales bacterium]|nr:sigma-70 family RNA polymerase sigma factor [Mycobacteriales bacterium]
MARRTASPPGAGSDADGLTLLVDRAKLGDIGALDTLLRDVRRAVIRYAAAQRVPRDDAEDLAQEVCLAVVKVIPDWRDTGKSVWGFVFAVARNKLTDGVRRQVRQGSLGRVVAIDDDAATGAVALPDGDPGPEDRAVATDGTRQMQRLLYLLPTTQREVLVLRAVVGLTAKETAAALGLTPGSVHVLQHRAVTRLRGLYSEANGAAAPSDRAGLLT